MQIIASEGMPMHVWAFFHFRIPRTIADWSASEVILSTTSLESFKSNLSAFLKVIVT